MTRARANAKYVGLVVFGALLLSGCVGGHRNGDDGGGGGGGGIDAGPPDAMQTCDAGACPRVLYATSGPTNYSYDVYALAIGDGYACWSVGTSLPHGSVNSSYCCQASHCAESVKTPLPAVAASTSTVVGIHNQHMYLVAGNLYDCPLSDLQTCTRVAVDSRLPVVTDTRAFWHGGASVSTCSLPSCSDQTDSVVPLTYALDRPSVTTAATPSTVYWIATDNTVAPAITSLFSFSAGGAASRLIDLHGIPTEYAADAKGNLYWIDTTSSGDAVRNLMTCSLASCTPRVFAQATIDPIDQFSAQYLDIATDDRYVYWRSYKLDSAKIYSSMPLVRCPLDGCPAGPETVMASVGFFTLAEGNLYWQTGNAQHGYSIVMTPLP